MSRAPRPVRVIAPERRAAGTPLMTLTRVTAWLLGRALGRLAVTGLDRVPAIGGVLVAVNHTAFVDGPLVYGVLRRPAVFLVKAEMFTGPLGVGLRLIGQIPVRRGTVERAPLQLALATLAAGGVVGVFPEGTRGTGDVGQVYPGIGYLAVRSGCPVVPVACHGTAALLPGGRPPRRRRPVRVAFGDPIAVTGGPAASRRTIAAAVEQIRAAHAAHVVATRPPGLDGPAPGSAPPPGVGGSCAPSADRPAPVDRGAAASPAATLAGPAGRDGAGAIGERAAGDRGAASAGSRAGAGTATNGASQANSELESETIGPDSVLGATEGRAAAGGAPAERTGDRAGFTG